MRPWFETKKNSSIRKSGMLFYRNDYAYSQIC